MPSIIQIGLVAVLVGGFGIPAWAGDVIAVAPSGDCEADAVNIEFALAEVEDGGTVLLTDGNNNTEDYYCSTRVIVAYEISATLRGEGPENTILEARGDGTVEAFLPDTAYQTFIWGSLVHYEYPGSFAIREMTFRAENVGGNPYFQLFTAWGGSGDTTIQNTAWIGYDASFAVPILVGPHIMRGSQGREVDGRGEVTIRDSHFQDLAYGPLVMWYLNSKITLKDLTSQNVNIAVWFQGFVNGSTVIKDSIFGNGGPQRIVLVNAPQTTIRDNVFDGIDQTNHPGWSTIVVATGGFDVTIRNNTFANIFNVNEENPAAAVRVRPFANNTAITIRDNAYDDGLGLAIRLGSSDSTVVEPHLQLDQIREEGDATNNIIRVGGP